MNQVKVQNASINLKDNLFLTLVGEFPENAKKQLSAYINYVNEEEAEWYVVGDKEKGFINYGNTKRTYPKATQSLISAALLLAPIGTKTKNIKFKLYILEDE